MWCVCCPFDVKTIKNAIILANLLDKFSMGAILCSCSRLAESEMLNRAETKLNKILKLSLKK